MKVWLLALLKVPIVPVVFPPVASVPLKSVSAAVALFATTEFENAVLPVEALSLGVGALVYWAPAPAVAKL